MEECCCYVNPAWNNSCIPEHGLVRGVGDHATLPRIVMRSPTKSLEIYIAVPSA